MSHHSHYNTNYIMDRLEQGLDAMDISLSQQQCQLLAAYLDEFHKWNKAYNLSAVREPEAMVSRHLLDSLALVPYLKSHLAKNPASRLLDVGTGGGLPGVPLAIAFPDLPICLLDSNGKKTRFLFQTAVKLGFSNIQVENKRAEHFSAEQKFAIVTSRAFASLADMVAVTRHLLAEGGEYWAMKGQYPQHELEALEQQRQSQQHLRLLDSHSLQIPDCDGDRHLLRFSA